jgi:hypothetical protein
LIYGNFSKITVTQIRIELRSNGWRRFSSWVACTITDEHGGDVGVGWRSSAWFSGSSAPWWRFGGCRAE